MTRYATTDNNGRIVSTAEQDIIVGGVLFGFPDDFDFSEQGDYLIVNSELVYDPLPDPTAEPTITIAERMDAVEAAVAEMILGGGR